MPQENYSLQCLPLYENFTETKRWIKTFPFHRLPDNITFPFEYYLNNTLFAEVVIVKSLFFVSEGLSTSLNYNVLHKQDKWSLWLRRNGQSFVNFAKTGGKFCQASLIFKGAVVLPRGWTNFCQALKSDRFFCHDVKKKKTLIKKISFRFLAGAFQAEACQK